MSRAACHALCLMMVALAAATPSGWATRPIGDHPIRQFLAQDDATPAYVAERRLEADGAGRTGWLTALTTYAPQTGFKYNVTGEGGSGFIRGRLLRALLDGERDAIAKGETARASIAPDNYEFKPGAIDENGLATVELMPRRRERVLVAGTITLRASDGDLVCLRGRLARSPSLWAKNVDIVRHYERIGGTILPVSMESQAQLRPFGSVALRMTYRYLEVNGHTLE
jgi:hypothetical protein